MTDLTKITTPFGLLDAETQERLRALEQFIGHLTYRQKPAPLTKPSIDWSAVDDRFNFLAEDGPSDGWIFERRPDFAGEWFADGRFFRVQAFASYVPGTCAAKDSLVVRPGYKEGAE